MTGKIWDYKLYAKLEEVIPCLSNNVHYIKKEKNIEFCIVCRLGIDMLKIRK